jgi:hypothetical protein
MVRNVDVVFVTFCHLKLGSAGEQFEKILWNCGEIDFGMLFHCVPASCQQSATGLPQLCAVRCHFFSS